jgi:hypothetical protein
MRNFNFSTVRNLLVCVLILLSVFVIAGCDEPTSSDTIQRDSQEKLLAEATKQTGMPAIKNFRERKILKDILELRDQEGLITYTYVFSEVTGKFTFLGETIGYGIPYATQYSNPQKAVYRWETTADGGLTLPQADPNGLFSPESAEGTWVLMRNPDNNKVVPIYVEPRIMVLPFKIRPDLLTK